MTAGGGRARRAAREAGHGVTVPDRWARAKAGMAAALLGAELGVEFGHEVGAVDGAGEAA